MSEETKGNSITNNVNDSKDFFDQLETSVNGVVSEGGENINNTEFNQSENGSEQVTHNESQGAVDWDSENNPYKKRYTDSSREAVKMNTQLSDLKPFVPVLNAMKRDSGLVDHVREYLQNGGKPSKNIKEQLNLSEDFVYDPSEAIEDPESESARVMQAQIDSVVNRRVNDVLSREKQNAAKMQRAVGLKKQEQDFMQKHNMSPENFENFKAQAKSRNLTLDDVYYILNKEQANQNVANSTKQDMLNQMKNVRNIPTTASDSNSQGTSQKSANDSMFDAMIGIDNSVDNLFG
jgi:hypothetical protein|tara:strand:- start:441 stop:1316 length:876 start_codon:yes stop_codon:yes gene_type:complete